MASYTVTRVRNETAIGGSHRHIAGVCTDHGTYYTRSQVVNSINAGNTWKTSSGGTSATIHPIPFCRYRGCMATPYITTSPDATTQDNLDHLPEC